MTCKLTAEPGTPHKQHQSRATTTEWLCLEQVIDTAGTHQFPAMQRLTISQGHAFILVYSVASQQTLEQLWPIYEEICEIKGSEMQYVPVVLVGNKSDEANREVPTEDGVGLAAQWKCCFMETSAKMNHNVQQLFKELFAMEKRKAVSLRVNDTGLPG
ncbi:GTP-binding protein Di-Ras2-like [Arapaima gigas]